MTTPRNQQSVRVRMDALERENDGLRAALERLLEVLEGVDWDRGVHGGGLAGAMVQAHAALKLAASHAPSLSNSEPLRAALERIADLPPHMSGHDAGELLNEAKGIARAALAEPPTPPVPIDLGAALRNHSPTLYPYAADGAKIGCRCGFRETMAGWWAHVRVEVIEPALAEPPTGGIDHE